MSDQSERAAANAETKRLIHDLRQPLAAMQMWADLLTEALRDQLGEKEARYLAKIRGEMTRMAGMLTSSATAAKDGAAARPKPGEAPASTVADQGARLAGLSLLLVEDDVMTAEALQLALEGEGATVAVAATIGTGLALFVESAPDAVLSDLRVSDGDGFQLVTEIRRLDLAAGRRTAALAVTGFDSAETRAASRAAGFDELVVKPFELEGLIQMVARLVAAR